MKHSVLQRTLLFLLLLLVLTIPAGCRGNNDSQVLPLPENEVITATETPASTATPEPTATPQPNRAVLIRSEGAAQGWKAGVEEKVEQLAVASGFVFEVRNQISSTDINPDWKLVFVLDSAVDVQALRNAAPTVQFVLFTADQTIEPDQNLTVLRYHPYHQLFVAGYVSILTAPDFRAGSLLVWDDDTLGAEAQQAFRNGAAYFCGRCPSVFAPIIFFPVTSSHPSTSSWETWLEGFTALHQQNQLRTVYLTAEAVSEPLVNSLAEQGIIIVGGSQPPVLPESWAATVTTDASASLEQVWASLVSGQSAGALNVPVSVLNVNETYLSTGRMRLVEEVIVMLEDGVIAPLSPAFP